MLVTCQGWLLTTQIECEESLFAPKLWTALDRTRYMQSSKTFVMVDRPFWKDTDPRTGRDVMSMTLTDRLTRGTYLFDNGDDQPGVICLTYSWMSDALKMLPEPVDRRVRLSLNALSKIYPDVDIASHIVGDPITVSWEADRHFLGAFKGALPGHYRYNQRMYAHFMQDRHAAGTAGHLHRRGRRLLDTRVGGGRGPDLAERGLGHLASPRRPNLSGQSRTRGRVRRHRADRAARLNRNQAEPGGSSEQCHTPGDGSVLFDVAASDACPGGSSKGTN